MHDASSHTPRSQLPEPPTCLGSATYLLRFHPSLRTTRASSFVRIERSPARNAASGTGVAKRHPQWSGARRASLPPRLRASPTTPLPPDLPRPSGARLIATGFIPWSAPTHPPPLFSSYFPPPPGRTTSDHSATSPAHSCSMYSVVIHITAARSRSVSVGSSSMDTRTFFTASPAATRASTSGRILASASRDSLICA